jgi:hypothetical protein
VGLFLTSFLVIALAGFGMALGVLFGRRPLAGTCGGMNAVEGAGCPFCSDPARATRRCRRAPLSGTKEAS